MKSKGIVIDKAALLVLAVVGIAVFSFVMIQIIPRVSGDLENYWDEIYGSGNTMDAVRFKNAVKCSYYRCVKGCNSDEVKRIDNVGINPENNMESLECIDFCDDNQIKNNAKICGGTEDKKPINVKINRNVFVKKDWFKDIAVCMIAEDSNVPIGVIGVKGIVKINNDVLGEVNKEGCTVTGIYTGITINDALSSAEVKPSNLKISSIIDEKINHIILIEKI